MRLSTANPRARDARRSVASLCASRLATAMSRARSPLVIGGNGIDVESTRLAENYAYRLC